MWFEYRPSESPPRHEVDNVVLAWPGRRAPGTPSDPSWRSSSVRAVEDLVGTDVECYPRYAYTADAIENWRRTRQPIGVVRDGIGLGRAAAGLLRVSGEHERGRMRPLSAQAARVLATTLRTQLASLDAWPWDDGTVSWHRSDDAWPRTFASYYVRPSLNEHEQRTLDTWAEPLGVPTSRDEADLRITLFRRLAVWREDVDPDSDSPAP